MYYPIMSHDQLNPASAEIEKSKINPIVERMAQMSHADIAPFLDAKAAVDPQAGIIIAPLTEIDPMIGPLDQEYDFYAARVLPPSKDNPNFVNPHVHFRGSEPYAFKSGTDGEMNIGRVAEGQVVWEDPKKVGPGDTVNIQEGQVHSFRNNGEGPADFTFACPKEHLIDKNGEHPEGDRQFTKGLKNGIPPWYLQ